ncbi:MarR family transcriptional regulator [Pseudoalteromonas sp. MMG010]|uniref:MarR family winged helix-turn-helix transcriptional regulator n=1 Tax=Pseudoalteromonas sp. MMG010 TaxID=2822685 RepID=UPI001B3A6BE8|nr:MarR family transcriptional regulator [Pseudoalteromonas sp. MMG010]MBQ4833833.1 MarR family transcriptional regulator [Pseudoalteromonas sp. MMG010]
MEFEQLRLKNQLCHRLYKASNSVVRAYREPLAALNLTYPQYIVMMALWEQDEISIAALIENTVIDGGALTQILKKMAEKQLVHIVKQQTDKRQKLVKLTSQGHALKAQASDIPERVSCKFTGISKDQVKQLMQLLDQIG